MRKIKIKNFLLISIYFGLVNCMWATDKPGNSPQDKMKMIIEKVQLEQNYDVWQQQQKQLRGIILQRQSMEQQLDMILRGNPSVSQFFNMYKQSVDKELNFHKELASLTWQIMPDLEAKAKAGKSNRNDWILLAKMHGYLNQFDEKVQAYRKALSMEALNRNEEEDLAKTLKGMNRVAESLDSWNRLTNLSGLDKEQKNAYKLESAWANFYIHRFDESLKILTELRKDPVWKSKTQQLYDSVTQTKNNWAEELEYQKSDKDLPRVEMLTSKGKIVLELFEDDAPNGVANFITLVQKKYYDGQKFHRVIPNFMAQGGDINSKNDNPNDDGSGGPGYTIQTELNKRKHFRGSLSYANAGLNTDGSQFFLCVVPTTWLDGRHAVFGRIIEGQQIADSLVKEDELKSVRVLQKRKHVYEVKKNS